MWSFEASRRKGGCHNCSVVKSYLGLLCKAYLTLRNKFDLQFYPNINPSPSTDGDYVINMSPEEYKVFQDNQKKPQAAPEEPADDSSVSVTQDPSKCGTLFRAHFLGCAI